MKRRKIRIVLFLSALTLTAACEKNQESSSSESSKATASRVEKLKQDAKDAVTTTTAYLIQQKEQFQKGLAEKMTEFDQQLSDLKARSGQLGEQAKSGWTRTLDQLEQKKQVAARKLEALKNSGADRWQEFKASAQAAFVDLEKAIKNAFARTKEDDKASRQ